MGSMIDDDSNSEDDSYDSDPSISDSGSDSDTDAYPTPAPSQRASLVPRLNGATQAEATSISAEQQSLPAPGDRRSNGAQPSGHGSPRDVSLSALSLAGKLPTENGTSAGGVAGGGNGRESTPRSSSCDRGPAPKPALRLDLTAAGDANPHSPIGNGSARASARNSSRSSARHRAGSNRAPALSIELVSPAFALDQDTLRLGEQSGAGPASVARQRAAAGLGLPATALRLFELREVPQDGELPAGVQRVAFSVANTRFSLSAVEETMAQNKRLMATNSHTTSALETLQQLVKDQNQALAKLKVQAGEATADACRLQERCNTADRFTVHLRQQLEHSEGLRVQGQAALAELKREFEVLTSELLAEGQVGEAAGLGAPSPRLLAQAAAAHHRALPALETSPAAALLAGPEGTRLTALLERFSDEKVLSRLEQCIEKAAQS